MAKAARPKRHGKKWRIRPYNEQGERISEAYDSYDDALFALERYRTHVRLF